MGARYRSWRLASPRQPFTAFGRSPLLIGLRAVFWWEHLASYNLASQASSIGNLQICALRASVVANVFATTANYAGSCVRTLLGNGATLSSALGQTLSLWPLVCRFLFSSCPSVRFSYKLAPSFCRAPFFSLHNFIFTLFSYIAGVVKRRKNGARHSVFFVKVNFAFFVPTSHTFFLYSFSVSKFRWLAVFFWYTGLCSKPRAIPLEKSQVRFALSKSAVSFITPSLLGAQKALLWLFWILRLAPVPQMHF